MMNTHRSSSPEKENSSNRQLEVSLRLVKVPARVASLYSFATNGTVDRHTASRSASGAKLQCARRRLGESPGPIVNDLPCPRDPESALAMATDRRNSSPHSQDPTSAMVVFTMKSESIVWRSAKNKSSGYF